MQVLVLVLVLVQVQVQVLVQVLVQALVLGLVLVEPGLVLVLVLRVCGRVLQLQQRQHRLLTGLRTWAVGTPRATSQKLRKWRKRHLKVTTTSLPMLASMCVSLSKSRLPLPTPTMVLMELMLMALVLTIATKTWSMMHWPTCNLQRAGEL